MIDTRRVRQRNNEPWGEGPIVYWMQRDQRATDNWALLYAQEKALQKKVPLIVVFNLVEKFAGATLPHFLFMRKGLQEVRETLQKYNIPFVMLTGEPEVTITQFIEKHTVGLLVTDFNPLRLPEKWKKGVLSKIKIACEEVDAHNIVPCVIASPKQEFAAHTFRPKIRSLYREFAGKIPALKKHPYSNKIQSERTEILSLNPNFTGVTPGEKAGKKMLQKFIDQRLSSYDTSRNDPSIDGQSNLSPYLHFGQLSAQRVAYEVEKSGASHDAKKAYLEELVVRKELSDNFCYYNDSYDSYDGIANWAKKSLAAHTEDVREFVYSQKEFEEGKTHDPLWNAAQHEMVITGKMHGYMRMYWAKKILEWTKTPQEAIKIAVTLNDRYSLDGRDPNGYVGILWSIGGVHDRAWFERPVFGKVRYMNYNGCKRKFDVEKYIANVSLLLK